MSNRTSRKSKVIAIPVSEPEGLLRAQMGDQEPKTEAEEMTDLINEVSTDEQPVAEPVEEIAPKPKAKRAPRVKAKAEPEPEVEDVSYEPPQEAIAEPKTADKVECPDCGKQMSAKTLRYSHAANCTVRKKSQLETQAAPSITNDIIEHEVNKRMNNFKEDRMARRQRAIESLVAQAF